MIKKLKQLFQHQGFKKYFANTSWLFAEKIIRMVVGFFIGVWVARYLGPDRYGLLSYAQAFVGLFSAVATLGLNGILVRELVKYPEKEDELLGTAFVLKLLGAVLTLIILYIAVHFTSNDTYTNILIFIVASGIIFQSFNVIDMYFQAKVMSKYIVFANSFSLLLSSVVKILLIINKAQLIYFALVVVFDNFTMALGYIYWFFKIKKRIFLKKIKFNFELAKNLFKDSWPLLLSGVVITIYMKIDQIMIKSMLNNKSVGNYTVAVKLSEIWYFIPTVITASLFPAIIELKNKNKVLYYKQLQNLYDLLIMLALCVAVPVSFFSKEIISILYGEKYDAASEVLKVYIWANVFVFLGLVSLKWFIVENLQKYSFYRTLSGMLVNIYLNFIFIPKYHILGAAVATVISQFWSSYLFNFFNEKTRINFKLQTRSLLLFFLYEKVINIIRKNIK